jgi:hypothetical protein
MATAEQFEGAATAPGAIVVAANAGSDYLFVPDRTGASIPS